MKNRLLLVALILLSGLLKAEEVIIGEATTTNQYLPSYSYYCYSLTQQIYTSEEIEAAGIINSIAFYNAGYSKTRTYTIYMVNTDKESFADNNDWITVTSDDIVFSGSVNMVSGEWTTFVLDDPFVYDGSNLAVIMDDNTGNWSSGNMNCTAFEASNQAIYVYSDGTNYDPYNPSGYYGTVLWVKNQIKIDLEQSTIICKKPKQFHCESVTSNTATLSWTAKNDETSWQIAYSMDPLFDPNSVTPVNVSENPFTLAGLTNNVIYYARVRANCGDGELSAWSNMCEFMPRDFQCVDLSDLSAPYIHCTYGDFYNPYAYNGIIAGRHTVITQQGVDPYTCGGLNMIPPGELYSIRLGNSNVGAEAESISCDILVDTADFDLLILKYAAVMQDPSHSPAEQPRFTFDILDTQNNPINPDCLSADFIASPSLGWNYCNSSGTVYWKDWTNVGVDISEFHGQSIRVRLTTYDCSQSGHFGYSYFILSCARKNITVDLCGYATEYTYSAPDGFEYNWYWQDDPSNSISTNQTITVPAGIPRILQCHVSFIGNSNCGFNLASSTGYRFPVSGFSVQNTECQHVFNFVNESFVSNDGVNPDGSGNICEDAFWDFGDGQTSTSLFPSHTYEYPGEYTVMMVAGLSGFSCTDTTYHIVNVSENVIDIVSCDVFEWGGDLYTESGTFSHNFTTAYGCDSLVTLNLTINPSYTTSLNITACDEYEWYGTAYSQTGTYQHLEYTVLGCDSLLVMTLDISNSFGSEETVTACNSYRWRGTDYTESGVYTDFVQAPGACDSTFVLNLTLGHDFYSDTTAVVCDALTWHGTTYSQSGDYSLTGQTAEGCDSIRTLHLTVNPSYMMSYDVASCDEYEWCGTVYSESGTYEYAGYTAAGCDSLLVLNLEISSSFESEETVTACDGYYWHGTTYSQSGDYQIMEQTALGCDSLMMLHLTVNPSYTTTMNITSCDEYEWYGEIYSHPGTYQHLEQTVLGCDSLLVLNLDISDSYSSEEYVTTCESYYWRGNTYTESGVYTDFVQAVEACDSTFILNLTIGHNFYSDTTAVVCDALTWHGITYDQSGDYSLMEYTAEGCDSIQTLHLTVNPSYTMSYDVAACEEYEWCGTVYSQSGTYEYMGYTALGCDSLLTLHLEVGSEVHNPVEIVNTCESPYIWHGHSYTQDGVYYDTLVGYAGCDDIYELDLSFVVEYDITLHETVCDSYPWPSAPGGVLTSTGHYLYDGVTTGGCDSVVDLDLTVHYTPNLVIDGITQVAMSTDLWPGVYNYCVADSAELADCTVTWSCSNPDWMLLPSSKPYWCMLIAKTLGQGTLTASTNCATGCDAEYSIEIYSSHFYVDETVMGDVLVYPNPANTQVTVEAQGLTQVSMYDSFGQKVKEEPCEGLDAVTIGVGDLPQGVYLVEVVAEAGRVMKRLIVAR